MNVRGVRSAVRRWAATVDRPLPWRGERDPYRVLVSEIMLQQTQASRVVPAYRSFVQRFPTLQALAAAEPADVLRAWGSLGYNRRALNLWRAARACPDGLPTTVEGLTALPGVGPYTARAVAVFAFGADAAPVDANVRRILSRLGDHVADVQSLADELVPRGGSRWWTQALFDLGATVCTPRRPRCDVCPLQTRCSWTADEPAVHDAPRFEETSRFARGCVVAALRRMDPMRIDDLEVTTGLATPRLLSAIGSLVRDGLVARDGGRVWLGPTVPARATRPRRGPRSVAHGA